jgi:membrane protein
MSERAAPPAATPQAKPGWKARWRVARAARLVLAAWRTIAETFRLYMEDNCGTYAAAIAYYAIFSLVPLSLIILSIFGLVVDQSRIEAFVFEQIPLKETTSVRDNVSEIVRRAHDVSAAGLGAGVVILFWSSSGIFTAVRRGLNAASHRQQRRPYWHGKLIDLALVPCLGVLILVSVGLTTVLQVVIERAGSIGPIEFDANLALRAGSYTLAALSSFVMFALLYRYVPSARPAWRESLAGAGLATVLFELSKNGYAAFFNMTPFHRETAVYAGFGTAMAFLLWMFINASILLLGAEFSRALRANGRNA